MLYWHCKPLLFMRLLWWGFSYHPGLEEFCSYFDHCQANLCPKRSHLDLILLEQELLRSVASIYAHAPVQLRVKNCLVFLTFPYPEPVPKKLCDFYWLQLQITCKSGWIAQAEKRYCDSKEGKSKLTQKHITPNFIILLLAYRVEEDKDSRLCSRSNGARFGLGRL